ncbi:hypothetical protein C6496_18360 [Candidatus Poribacteria bacterium]|nr:MAG: hypothetical protein C6496_18360 [Candidatus Poribacteria bacterium]
MPIELMEDIQMKETPEKLPEFDPKTYSFRNATKDDLDEVAALYRDWVCEDVTRGLVADTVGALLCRLGPHFILATDKDERVVGFAIAEVSSEHICVFPRGDNYLVLHDLYVTPDSRRQGIGSSLVTAILQSGRAKGIRRFTIYSANKHWQPTLDFYQEFGFEMWSFSLFLHETSTPLSE